MTDIDFMCEICHIDDLLAQMTEEEKLGLVLLFIRDVKKAKDGDTEMLTLPIEKQWFDMIRSGEKTEEYREITP